VNSCWECGRKKRREIRHKSLENARAERKGAYMKKKKEKSNNKKARKKDIETVRVAD
jgi:hypothetical protein